MAFDPAFLDELRARTPIAAVIGRKTRLARSGRQHKGCCPFHGEKTPSFYVYDDHFHCFGCGAHGDVISFVMQSDGHSFLEAVNQLAAEAGLDVPRQGPAERERAERSRTVLDALDAAQRVFAAFLRAEGGRAARDYLRGRGVSDEAIGVHGIGWSGDGRGALRERLQAEGMGADLLAEAGLLRVDEDGRPRGELFFNRVTFPIRDRKGRVVSFGGRILGDGQPKYLNGPETAVFSKRRTLFGLDRATAALRGARGDDARARAIVVEGYLDVIALHSAGFPGAVAPLGTALTREQLDELWRLDPAPVLCFDGDGAGRRAAIRALETALPFLEPDKTLRFVLLPEGEDPDSLVRGRGADGVAALLADPRPLSDTMFELMSENLRAPGPEQKAALHGRLTAAAATIGHKGLAAEYRRALTQLFFERFSRRRPQPERAAARPAAGRTLPDADRVRRERCRTLLAIILHHPGLLYDVEQPFCDLDLPAEFRDLRAAILDAVAAGPPARSGEDDAEPAPLDGPALLSHLRAAGFAVQLDGLLAAEPLPLPGAARAGSMPAEAEEAWWQFYGLMDAGGLRSRIEALETLPFEEWTSGTQRQLITLRHVELALKRGEPGEEAGSS